MEKLKTKLKIFLKLAQFSGEDSYGNCYYESRNIFTGVPKNPRRWIIYNGHVEGSKVPALWHAWLHGYGEAVSSSEAVSKPFLPNLTGTMLVKGEGKKPPKKHYHPWTP